MIKYTFWLLLVVILGGGSSLSAQTADGGIFGSGSTLSVKFRPSADITGIFTSGNFGIRWLSSLGAGVNLSGETGSFGYTNQGPKLLTAHMIILYMHQVTLSVVQLQHTLLAPNIH